MGLDGRNVERVFEKLRAGVVPEGGLDALALGISAHRSEIARLATPEGKTASQRQPQLDLRPFDKQQLLEVALKLRDIYPTRDRGLLERKVSSEYVARLFDEVTERFRGDVDAVPRQFLRRLVDAFDWVNDNDDSDPTKETGFEVKNPT